MPTGPGSVMGNLIGNTSYSGTQDTNRAEQQQGTTGQQSLNVFTPGQQALQGQAAGFFGGLLGGRVPEGFGMPQVVYDAAMANFNKFQAPQLAAQYGSGSPTINSALEQLQLQLAAQGAQMAHANAINAGNAAGDFALRPIGVNQNTQAQQTGNAQEHTTYSGQTTGMDIGGLLGAGLGILGDWFP